jgi:hypothetical protein
VHGPSSPFGPRSATAPTILLATLGDPTGHRSLTSGVTHLPSHHPGPDPARDLLLLLELRRRGGESAHMSVAGSALPQAVVQLEAWRPSDVPSVAARWHEGVAAG